MVCVVRFRDAKERKVAAAELVSGRLLQQICLEARRLAFDRDARTGDAGVRVADMEAALEHAIERLRTTLSPRNIHAYLDDLPQDIAVVAVDPVKPKIKRAHRYLNA